MDNPWNLHENWIIVPSFITSISISYCSLLSKQNQFQGLGAHMQRVHTDVPNEFTVIQTKVKSPKVFVHRANQYPKRKFKYQTVPELKTTKS